MQGAILLIGGISRLILVIGLIYVFYKLGRFLDVLPTVLGRRIEEEK
jgi:hypothetical protein